MNRPIVGGRVYMVGAGPGDPDLLTLRAAAVLAAADVVFHDQLVSNEVLACASPTAELIDVGHRAGAPRRDLAEVVDRMANCARKRMVVVRLKGGDPYLFGRGGEEVQALVAQGIPFEVVPGVSSALAAPAAIGIPLTYRELASSVLIVTGHQCEPVGALAWESLRADTVVVLMALSRLRQISRQMIGAGWDPSTPATVIMAATTSSQRQVTASLAEIADRTAEARLGSPSLLVVGAVVALSHEWARDLLAAAAVRG